MTIIERDRSQIPSFREWVKVCKDYDVYAVGEAVSRNTDMEKAQQEAAKEARQQMYTSRDEADFNCSNNGCGKNSICLEDNHTWKKKTILKFVDEGSEGSQVKWRAIYKLKGKQSCECEKISDKIGYKPGLKQEFAAVRRAMLRLNKKNMELQRKRKTKSIRKSTTRRRR